MRIIGWLICIFCLISCDNEVEEYSTVFEELAPSDHHIDFINQLTYNDQINIIEYLYFNNGGGVAIGDIDNDGLEDIYLTANQLPDRLYRNLGNLKFQDITQESGLLMIDNWSSGVTMDDVNGDGWLDISVCKVAPASFVPTHNLLYINQQDGTFRESAVDYGLDFSGYSTQASFFDYDLDGDLDVYLLNHSVHSTRSYGNIQLRQSKSELSGDRLYENRLNESSNAFVDVTDGSGIYSSPLGYGLGVATADINADGHIDIYVGNDFHENDYLYINNGDRTFTESIKDKLSHTSQYTMGVDVADINGDEHLDIFTTDMMPYDPSIKMRSGGNDSKQVADIKKSYGFVTQYARNNMQINRPDLEGFTEEAMISSVFATDWSWSVLLQDFNNDELTDIFISNGIINRPNDLDYINYINTEDNRREESETDAEFNTRLINQMPTLKIPNILFTQQEQHRFSDIQSSFIGAPNYSNGAAYADLDNDGDLDIITNNINGPISLLENTSNKSFVQFEVPYKNTAVTIHYGGKSQKKESLTTRGFQSSSSAKLHFGLGDYKGVIDSVVMTISGGRSTIFYDIAIDQSINLNDGDEFTLTNSTLKVSPLVEVNIPIVHNDYDDFDYEPLAPIKLSQEGPAIAIVKYQSGEALYIGGSHEESAKLYTMPDLNGSVTSIKEFEEDIPFEDVDALALDFNNDGYSDLYVMSGGNQYGQLDPLLKDRFYYSDKEGNLIKVPVSLPQMNGSTVSADDYDQDGFMDLFVGSRNVPGSYGLSPISFILRNKEGRSVEIVHKLNPGMVTDSRWIDIDADGDKELLAVGEWMSPIILDEQEGKFIDISSDYGLENLRGMFSSIEVADVNADGRIDIFLGNIGQNTTWQTNGKDITMYVHDYDENGSVEPIIFNNHLGSNVTFADKALLQSQFPSLKKTHDSYVSFSEIRTMSDLVPDLDNEQVVVKRANTLASLLLLSTEDGYEVLPLPREAQLSCINDLLWINDHNVLIYGANATTYSHELGQSMAGGAGKITFSSDQGEVSMTHQFINIPFGSVVNSIERLSDDRILYLTNKGAYVQRL